MRGKDQRPPQRHRYHDKEQVDGNLDQREGDDGDAAAVQRVAEDRDTCGGCRKQEPFWKEFRREGQRMLDDAIVKVAEAGQNSGIAERLQEMSAASRVMFRSAVMNVREHADNAKRGLEAALEDLIEGGIRQRRTAHRRALDVYSTNADQVWDAFFARIFESVDVGLCEGWITREDLSEPFIQLGMPAAAVVAIALDSRPNIGVTLSQDVRVTSDDVFELEEVKDLFEQVERIKLAAVRLSLRDDEMAFLRKASLCASSRDCDLQGVGEARRTELNVLLADVQRVAVKLTQSEFYKARSENFIQELDRREKL